MIDDELRTRFLASQKKCTRSLIRHPEISMSERLSALAEDAKIFEYPDIYGEGKLIADFEKKIATLLGMPAGLFLASGTMAQPIALRIWAEDKSSPWFAMHPTSHIELHELKGYQALHQLKSVLIGDEDAVPTLDNIKNITDPVSSIVLELPMREIGGQLPIWEDLVAQSKWARKNKIAMHMDGARLWQVAAAYNKTFPEITALFDSVYVSFYKDLGGIAGSMLLGPEWFIASARTWSRRYGGNLYSYFPYLLAAKSGVKHYLPKIPEARNAAIWAAEFFNQQPKMHTVPTKPDTNMFHLHISEEAKVILERTLEWSSKNGIAILPLPRKTELNKTIFEMNFGTNVLVEPKEWWITQISDLVQSFKKD